MQLATQQIRQQGITPLYSAASVAGDTFTPSDQTVLHVKNADGVSHTVTIHTTASAFGQPIGNIVIAVSPGTQVFMGPYDPAEVGAPGTGQATVTYDAVTGMTIAALAI